MAKNRLLRIARKLKGLSQEDVAKALNVDSNTYSRWERGIQEPHGYNLLRLCQVLGCSMNELGYDASLENVAEPDDQPGMLVQLTSEQSVLVASLLGDSTMDPKKRATLRLLLFGAASTAVTAPLTSLIEPWERLLAAAQQPSALNSHALNHFKTMLTTCWQLSNMGELATVEKTLSAILPRLMVVAPRQPEVAALVAQGLHLKSILAAHLLSLADKLILCKQSVVYARLAQEPNTLVIALAELAVSYKYANQLEDSLRTYQEALLSAHHVSPLVRSRIYAATASAFALCGRKEEGRFYIDLAYNIFPATHPEQDPNFPFADYNSYTLAYYDGIVHLASGDGEAAWKAFDRYKEFQPDVVVPERNRLETVNQKARVAALLVKDLDQYALYLEDGLVGSVSLHSRKRFEEVVQTYQEIPPSWRLDSHIKALAEQYALQELPR